MVLGFVAAENGIAILSDASQHLSRGNVVYRSLRSPIPLCLDFELMWRTDTGSDCTLHFLKIVRSIVKTLKAHRFRANPELARF